MKTPASLLIPLILLVLGTVFFMPFLGQVHLFDWDEINFAESAREMIETGQYFRVQIDFQPFWEKPPLFFWLQVMSMDMFGITEFAARFPNAVFGCLTLVTLFFIGSRLHGDQFGFLWALAYLGSILPHFYFKSGIIDPVFNFFIFLGISFIAFTAHRYPKGGSPGQAALAGIFLGLAVMTKGPVAILVSGLVCGGFLIWNRFRRFITFTDLAVMALALFITSLMWFGYEFATNGPWFIEEFVRYQVRLFSTPDAGHGQPFWYHFVVVFVGCFPISVLAIPSLANYRERDPSEYRRWMALLFWVVMILFSIVTTKIVHYSSLSYFPLSYLAALHLNQYLIRKVKPKKSMWIWIGIHGSILGLVILAVPIVLRYRYLLIIPRLKDPFAAANLSVPVNWTGLEGLGGLVLIAGSWIGMAMVLKKNPFAGAVTLFLCTAVTVFTVSVAVVPKIEPHTQGAAIAYFQELAGRDAYVDVKGYKSYAQLYYGGRKPEYSLKDKPKDWLLTGKVDRPVYLVVREDRLNSMEEYTNFYELDRRGGFVLFKRMDAPKARR